MLQAVAFLLALAVQDVAPDTAARFEKALKKLDADDFQERQDGSQEIAGLPADALALVEAALQRPDATLEVRTRLERTLPILRAKGRRAALAKKAEAHAAWSRKTVLEAYEKSGRRDPTWDAPAREALRVVSFLWGDAAADVPDPQRRAYDQSLKAIEAGCDDPMILYARARMYDGVIRKDLQEAVRLHVEAARAMKERGTSYHAIRRAFPYFRAGEFLGRAKKALSDAERKEALDWLELAVAAFAEAVKDPGVSDVLLLEFGEGLSAAWKTLTKDRKAGVDKVIDAIAKARPESALPLLLKGRVYVDCAWDARGSGWANSVTEEGWKNMKARLAEAEEALVRAHEKDPGDAEPPTQMLVVELGQGKGRPAMERWYRKAMEADRDNLSAVKKKMYYLEPKWHGSAEDMLGFGRELLREGNWEARLPFQLVDAHLTLSGYEKDKAAYWRGEAAWPDIQSVYEAVLKREPVSDHDRTWYAKLACWCGKWKEAKGQFDLLGGKAVVSVFKDAAELDRLRAEAMEKGR